MSACRLAREYTRPYLPDAQHGQSCIEYQLRHARGDLNIDLQNTLLQRVQWAAKISQPAKGLIDQVIGILIGKGN